MENSEFALPAFLPSEVKFQDGSIYSILQPLTNYKVNHFGTPVEAATVVSCKQIESGKDEPRGAVDVICVMKIKVQVPEDLQNSTGDHHAGPSNTTSAELKALTTFANANSLYAPRIMNWKQEVQGNDWPLPGGYLTYIVMTMIPGRNLHQLQFWAMSLREREEITREFLKALRAIYALGIEPIDRGLRNIIWDSEGRKCGIIDFELWRERAEALTDEARELVKWGLAHPPITRDYVNGYFTLFNSTSI